MESMYVSIGNKSCQDGFWKRRKKEIRPFNMALSQESQLSSLESLVGYIPDIVDRFDEVVG